MNRSEFLKGLGLSAIGLMGLPAWLRAVAALPDDPLPLPGLFIGHGTPDNILADNSLTQAWAALGRDLPRPKAIVVVSAHWLTRGSFVSAVAKPAIIADFFGYPAALGEVAYPVAGSPAGAKLTQELLSKSGCEIEPGRGLDHGAWMVLRHMYPLADIPAFQLSIDRTKSLEHYLQLGKLLRSLRAKGVLVIGSGNITHNLAQMAPEFEAPVPEWAEEFDMRIKNLLERGDVKGLLQYPSWGRVAELSHPSSDHFLPLLYAAGLLQGEEQVKFVHEGFEHGTLSMRCVQFG
jgi:4,5-DOPA dioxygenase extradiol